MAGWILGIALGAIAAAAGIVQHRSWARVLSALVAGLSLLVDGLALVWSVVARLAGEPAHFDPFLLVTIVAWLIVLFAVLRRW